MSISNGQQQKVNHQLRSQRDRLAETLYAGFIAQGRAMQKIHSALAQEAREAAEAFYPDELPVPSVPMTKAV